MIAQTIPFVFLWLFNPLAWVLASSIRHLKGSSEQACLCNAISSLPLQKSVWTLFDTLEPHLGLEVEK